MTNETSWRLVSLCLLCMYILSSIEVSGLSHFELQQFPVNRYQKAVISGQVLYMNTATHVREEHQGHLIRVPFSGHPEPQSLWDYVGVHAVTWSDKKRHRLRWRHGGERSALRVLTSAPEAGYVFTGWTVNGAQVQAAAPLLLSALPVLAQNGTPTPIPATNQTTCQARYEAVAVDLTVEESLTACMEDRRMTFSAAVSSNFPTPVTFTFQYQRPDGTIWHDRDWSLDRIEHNTRVMELVSDSDPDHRYTTSTLVTSVQDTQGVRAASNTVTLDVHTLWIDDVRDAASGKSWKAVVGEPMTYQASASPDCANWPWEMPDTPDGWVFGRRWHPTGGEASSTDSGGTPLLIPERDLPFDAEWDHFGEHYGRVRVSYEASDGNRYARDSTDQTPARRVQVFFDPSDKTPHAGLLQPSHEIPKNFFYYWLAALGNFPHVFWDDYHHALASTSPVTGEIFIGDLGNSYEIESSEIRLQKRLNYIGGTCPALYEFNGCPIYVRPGDGKKKIDLFLAVLSHELQHRSDAINNYLIPAANCELPHPDDVDNDCLKNAADPFPNMVNGVGYWEYAIAQDVDDQ